MNELILTKAAGPLAVPQQLSTEQIVALGRSNPKMLDIARSVCEMRDGKFPGNLVECPVVHRFNGKMYIRECSVLKGTRFISKIHKTEHLCALSKGVLAVWTETGGVKILVAPYYGITPPGTLRVMIAVEDLIWTTFHFTDKTDVSEIEDDLVVDPGKLLLEE